MPPPVLNATPGSPTANTYATVAEANAYHDAHVAATAWVTAEGSTKARALVQATRLLDQHVQWVGVRTYPDQALGMPRSGSFLGRPALDADGRAIDPGAIPAAVKWATAELARLLIEGAAGGGEVSADLLATLKRLKAGPVDIEFKADASGTTTTTARHDLPDAVYSLVRHLARRVGGSAMGTVPTVRT